MTDESRDERGRVQRKTDERQDTAQQMKAEMKKDGLVLCPPVLEADDGNRAIPQNSWCRLAATTTTKTEDWHDPISDRRKCRWKGIFHFTMKNEAKKIRVFDIQLGTTEIFWDFFSYFTVTYFDIRYMNKNKQSFSSNDDASSSTFQLQLAVVSRFWTLYARKQKEKCQSMTWHWRGNLDKKQTVDMIGSKREKGRWWTKARR